MSAIELCTSDSAVSIFSLMEVAMAVKAVSTSDCTEAMPVDTASAKAPISVIPRSLNACEIVARSAIVSSDMTFVASIDVLEAVFMVSIIILILSAVAWLEASVCAA